MARDSEYQGPQKQQHSMMCEAAVADELDLFAYFDFLNNESLSTEEVRRILLKVNMS